MINWSPTVSRVGKLKVIEIDWRIEWIVVYNRSLKAKLVSWCPCDILPSGMFYHPGIVHIHTLGLEIGMLFLCVPQVKGRHLFEA